MSGNLKKSLALRMAIVAGLTLLLLIPSAFIQNLISERRSTHDQAIVEVSGKWGGHQTIAGPFLSLPFRQSDGQTEYAHFLPEQLEIKGQVEPNLRYRGIYKVLLFQAKLEISGLFRTPAPGLLGIENDQVDWDRANIVIGVSDIRGIKELARIQWNDETYVSESALPHTHLFGTGIGIDVPISREESTYAFKLTLSVNGSKGISFIPAGKETSTKIASGWVNPSFTGLSLPDRREVNDDGFRAEWRFLQTNRSFPQAWAGNAYSLKGSEFGVDLIFPVDEYQKTMRTAKYAIMFISITFLAFFMVELLNRRVLHPVHYLLTGFALLLFYTLLLSFSEHLSFSIAYWIASLAVVALIAFYIVPSLGGPKQTALVSGLLLLLYTFFYVVLQMQDYALIMGSLGLFLILSIVMWLTRKMDWFSILNAKSATEEKTGGKSAS
jgi:inner membrane protein